MSSPSCDEEGADSWESALPSPRTDDEQSYASFASPRTSSASPRSSSAAGRRPSLMRPTRPAPIAPSPRSVLSASASAIVVRATDDDLAVPTMAAPTPPMLPSPPRTPARLEAGEEPAASRTSPLLFGQPASPPSRPLARTEGADDPGGSRTSPIASSPRSSSPRKGLSLFRTTSRPKIKTPAGAVTPDFATCSDDGAGGFTGWLWKQKAEGRVNLIDGGWKARFCVYDAAKKRLYYYHYENEKEHANFVSIDSRTHVEPCPEHVCPEPELAGFAFALTTSYTHRPYVFCAGTQQAMEDWVRVLLRAQGEAEAVERAIGESVDVIWASYESARSSSKLNTPTLDVSVEQGSCSIKGDYFVACYGKDDQKFRTWIEKATNSPVWHCDGTFVDQHERLRIKFFSRNVAGGHRIVAEDVLDLSAVAAGEVHDQWYTIASTRKGFEARVLLRIQKSRAFAVEPALNWERGVPTGVLPLRVDTGDIVLFHNAHFASQATKVFTRSQWDHVGVIVRWRDNELKLLEVTSQGVGLYKLSARLAFLATNTKMAVRRLLGVRRTPAMLYAIDEFIQQMRGRHYKKRLGVLVKAALRDEKDGSSSEQDLSSVFCSELVVAAWQRMGLLPDSLAAKGFLPRDLADKENKDLPLLLGATLERKRIFTKKKDRGNVE